MGQHWSMVFSYLLTRPINGDIYASCHIVSPSWDHFLGFGGIGVGSILLFLLPMLCPYKVREG